MVAGSFLFFRGPFLGSLASLDLAGWVSEVTTGAIAVGVVIAGVSADRKRNVLDLVLTVLGGTGEELMEGCSVPAERLLEPCTSVPLRRVAAIVADRAGVRLAKSVVEREEEPCSVGKRGAISGSLVAVFFCTPN